MSVAIENRCGKPHGVDRTILCIRAAGHPGEHRATMVVRWAA